MSTRCCVDLYDYQDTEKPTATLYHSGSGYPEFMRGKLERFVAAAVERCGSDASRVAAAMIYLSAEDYENPVEPNTTNKRGLMDPERKPGEPYKAFDGLPAF